MAAVVRVKRRINEDPAEALIVSCKRQRQDGGSEAAGISFDERIRFSYAGTLNSKEAPVPRQIRDAIHKDQLQAQYKQHVNNITENCRSHRRSAAKANRYKIVCSRRAGGFEYSEEPNSQTLQTTADANAVADGCSAKSDSLTQSVVLESGKTSNCRDQTSIVDAESGRTANHTDGRHPVLEMTGDTVQSAGQSINGSDIGSSHVQENGTPGDNGEEILHVYDVEQDEDEHNFAEVGESPSEQASGSGITFNGVELVSERIPAMRRAAPESFVYDLYYNQNAQYDFRALENILSIQALHDELVLEDERDEDCDEVYEDEDDSNDENNWRNDYPEEDPRFFENDTAEYYYGEDILTHEPTAFAYGEDDALADWMSARCNVGEGENVPIDDDEDAMYSKEGQPVSYRGYMQHLQDVKQDDEEDCGLDD